MNTKQIFGMAGGFLFVYILITLTNKPQAPVERGGPQEPPAAATDAERPGGPGATAGRGAMGFGLAGLGAETLASAETDARLRAIASAGGWVAISPALFQADAYASAVEADADQTPSESSLRHAIAECRALGLRVLLRPVVVAKDGTRRERFVPADPGAWFASYGRALAPFVAIAEAEHVEVLSLGANYAQLEQTQPWGDLIRQTRERYRGQLTYGAGLQSESGNGGYRQVPFWSSLDVVGFEAPSPAGGDWSAVESELDAWMQASQAGRQALFTSAGFGAGETEPESYRAFKSGLGSRPWLAGAHWYQWDPALEARARPASERAESDGDEAAVEPR